MATYQLARFGVPRVWDFGGSITSSKPWVNMTAAKKRGAASLSQPGRWCG